MRASDVIYRATAWLRHNFTARNTLGHGIHSPYLYNMVRFLIYDDNSYYCFSQIERERRRLLSASNQLYITDFGSGVSGSRRVCDAASSSLMPARDAQMLFRIVNHLHPQIVVELGTSLGITTSYLSVAAGSKSMVYTFEGSRSLLAEAETVWRNLHCGNITPQEGNIDVTLEQFLRLHPRVDFALIDANHRYEPTLRYFDLLSERSCRSSIIAMDDIHYSVEMGKAWEQVKRHPRVVATMDFYGMGLVFFDRRFLPKHYIMRY